MSLRKAWYTLVQVAYDLVLKMNPRKMAAHAVILNQAGQVLLLRSRYADLWALPGGGLGRRENLDTALIRECREELGVGIAASELTGIYFQTRTSTYIAIFRCQIIEGEVSLSHEHSGMRWSPVDEVPERLRPMVADALDDDKRVIFRTFA